MNLRYKERIAMVACICWLVIALFITDPFSREETTRNTRSKTTTTHPDFQSAALPGFPGVAYSVNNWGGFAVTGLLPVVTILGIMWIWRGKEDSDQDKDNTNPS